MRGELLPARPDCPDPGRWLAPDSDATETDVSALIGGFVLALKPDFVVETGTYLAHTTVMIGGVLKALGRGHLLSIDIDPARTLAAQQRVDSLPVTLMTAQASQVVPPQPIDLLFIDCGLADRLKQLRNFSLYASNRCVVLFHDSALPIDVPGVADMYQDMDLAVSSGLVQPWIKLPTPRGLAITRYV